MTWSASGAAMMGVLLNGGSMPQNVAKMICLSFEAISKFRGHFGLAVQFCTSDCSWRR